MMMRTRVANGIDALLWLLLICLGAPMPLLTSAVLLGLNGLWFCLTRRWRA